MSRAQRTFREIESNTAALNPCSSLLSHLHRVSLSFHIYKMGIRTAGLQSCCKGWVPGCVQCLALTQQQPRVLCIAQLLRRLDKKLRN